MNELAGEYGSTSPEAPSHSTEPQECWLLVERDCDGITRNLPVCSRFPGSR